MHILLIPSWFPKHRNDLAGVFFWDQAEALRQIGHEVGVLVQYPVGLKNSLKKRQKLTSGDVDGVVIYRNHFIAAIPKIPYGIYWLWKHAAYRQFTKYLARHGRPDVIHAHSALYGGAIAVRLGRKFGIPVVITEHSSAFALNLLSQWELRLAKAAFAAADECIAVSETLAGEVRRLLGDREREILVVPNVVARRFLACQPKSHSGKGGKKIILNIGSLDVNKAQFDLIAAFAKVVRQNQNAELWLVGDGPERPRLETLSASLGLTNKVKFLGNMPPDKIPALLAEADLLAISSHYETFGVVAAEALVLGKPVVSTRCGGPNDIVTVRDGVLVPVNSSEQLGAAMEYVIQNPDAYDVADIASRARLRFDGATIARRLTDIYEALQLAC